MAAKRPHKQILLGQNFLKSPGLVRRLVDASTIGPADTVLETGPGRGIITAELARRAKQVIAVEKDTVLVRRLRERFREVENVRIVEGDFLEFSFRYLQARTPDYKIFASIPYNSTARIVRKILYERPVPSEAYLILQKEPARKFSGEPRETLFSILAKPFFEFQIIRELKPSDFEPVPNVDSVLLRIERRARPLIIPEEIPLYRDFVHFGFGRWKRHLRSAFKSVFTYKQWKRLSRELQFPLDATPTQLSFEQWLDLYLIFKQTTCNKQNAVTGQSRRG